MKFCLSNVGTTSVNSQSHTVSLHMPVHFNAQRFAFWRLVKLKLLRTSISCQRWTHMSCCLAYVVLLTEFIVAWIINIIRPTVDQCITLSISLCQERTSGPLKTCVTYSQIPRFMWKTAIKSSVFSLAPVLSSLLVCGSSFFSNFFGPLQSVH